MCFAADILWQDLLIAIAVFSKLGGHFQWEAVSIRVKLGIAGEARVVINEVDLVICKRTSVSANIHSGSHQYT